MSAILEMTDDSSVPSPLGQAEILAAMDAVLEAEGVSRDCVVSLSLVDDEDMRGYNREWRGIDAPTDVLSFEMDRPDLAHGAGADELSAQGDEPCELGDIVLAPDYVRRQAPRFGNTPADEMLLLLVHGMLHLLGYDHIVEEEARRMEAREDELVAGIVGSDRVTGGTVTRHGGDEA
ncbi:MAG: rRNA maturation RNase YbeY [Atopobiaceae bacterium]|jgi:probable rRNA maturation factor|nr:rRNA maturation RNase YbeY [Atopobiaceae bacterium]